MLLFRFECLMCEDEKQKPPTGIKSDTADNQGMIKFLKSDCGVKKKRRIDSHRP